MHRECRDLGIKGEIVKFTEGKFKGRVGFLDDLAGDAFYYVIDPLNGERIFGYLGEMETLADNYFESEEK